MAFLKIYPEAVSVEEMQDFDCWATEIGLSPLVLMENAGRAVALAAKGFLPKRKTCQVAIFAGRGFNGGDGFVAARYLNNWGIKVNVFLVTRKGSLKREAKINFEVLLNLKVDYLEIKNQSVWQKVSKDLKHYDLIIDAILGTGLKKPIEGLLRKIIKAINKAECPVLAVDIPSGMDGNTGQVLGCAVKAEKTVTMAAPKKGFLTPIAKTYLGELEMADLGVAFRKVR